MPSPSPSPSPLARLLRPDPSRDLFRLLADSLPEAVLALSADGRRLLAANHAFLLLTGYARNEVGALDPEDLFAGEAGERALSRVLGAWDTSETLQEDVPLRTRPGDIVRVDVHGRTAGPGRGGLLRIQPVEERQRAAAQEATRSQRLSRLVQLTAHAVASPTPTPSETADAAREFLGAAIVGSYRLSAAGSEYVMEGALPTAFPPTLPPEALSTFDRPGSVVSGPAAGTRARPGGARRRVGSPAHSARRGGRRLDRGRRGRMAAGG